MRLGAFHLLGLLGLHVDRDALHAASCLRLFAVDDDFDADWDRDRIASRNQHPHHPDRRRPRQSHGPQTSQAQHVVKVNEGNPPRWVGER